MVFFEKEKHHNSYHKATSFVFLLIDERMKGDADASNSSHNLGTQKKKGVVNVGDALKR